MSGEQFLMPQTAPSGYETGVEREAFSTQTTMSEREFVIYLDEAQENRYRHRHVWERGEIVEFRIQYEAFIAGQWHAIVRYDSAHGEPHRDVLHPDGTQTKEMYPGYSNAEVLTIGQRDIMENWPEYRAAYEKEME